MRSGAVLPGSPQSATTILSSMGNGTISRMSRVVYVHNVVGAHTANPMSGEFSVELSNAFWMEDGSFETPIRSAMLSGNVFELHKEIAGLSRESRSIGSVILPSIKINKQHIIGK